MDNGTVLAARRTLFDDATLGAGNFLQRAHAAFEGRGAPFLWLEQPFVAPSGISHPSLSLDGLMEVTRSLARWYVGQDVRAGEHVCIYVGDGVASFLHFLALNSLGCVPVLINGHLRVEIARLYAERNGFTRIVHDAETARRWDLDGLGGELRRLDAAFEEGRQAPLAGLPAAWPAERYDDDIVMICHSSGTTGVPKAVLFGHRQFFTGKRERLLDYADPERDRLATAMPPTHAAGVSYLMTATLLQCPTLALATQVGARVAEQVAAFGATIMTAFSQTYASLASLDLPDGALGAIRRFYNTGDTAHTSHIRQMLRLAPEGSFIDMFGASELGMSQFFKTSTRNDVARKRCVGAPAAYAHCDVLTPSGDVLTDNQPGYIGVKSPTVTPGYYGQPEMTALSTINDYWLTGDVGLRLPNGEYVHLDRIVDMIDTGFGMPAYTLLLEEHLLTHPDVFDASVVGVRRGPTREETVVVLVRPAQGRRLSAGTVLRHALGCFPFAGRGDLPPYALAVGILADVVHLPTGATGKVLKRVVRDEFWNAVRDLEAPRPGLLADLAWNQDEPSAPHPSAAPVSLLQYLSA